jgi:tetratricopeptide (TPR) repeat protein
MTMKVYVIWGRYEESLSNFQSLLKHSDEINDRRMQADALNNMALIHYSRGEYDRALELYNQSLEIARKIGDQWGIAGTLNNIAWETPSIKGRQRCVGVGDNIMPKPREYSETGRKKLAHGKGTRCGSYTGVIQHMI